MLPIMIEVAERMVKVVGTKVTGSRGQIVNLKDYTTKYATDTTASIIFGQEIDSFKNPNNDFRKIIVQFTAPGYFNNLRKAARFLVPGVYTLFRKLAIPDRTKNYLVKLVKDIAECREKNGIVRKDIMQMLLQLRNSGKVNSEDNVWKIKDIKASGIDSIYKFSRM